jgi:hypothetical protein
VRRVGLPVKAIGVQYIQTEFSGALNSGTLNPILSTGTVGLTAVMEFLARHVVTAFVLAACKYIDMSTVTTVKYPRKNDM